jgi:hypothetical protein
MPRTLTPGEQWRKRRNQAIYIPLRDGLPQRLLADVFGLSRAGMGAVVRRVAKALVVPGSLDQIDAQSQDRKKALVAEIWFDPPANIGARITVSSSAVPAGSQVITHR